MIESFISALLNFLESIGYPGIFILSAMESSFVPIPSEMTMIPTGYLIYQGKMSAVLAFLSTVSGLLCGALFCYWLAWRFGRKFLVQEGRKFFLNAEKLEKMDRFFQKHGPISIFIGRLIFGVRHYISFPAGLAKMDLKKFCLYTVAGGSLWTATLLTLGYAAGGNEQFILRAVPAIKAGFFMAAALAIFIYIRRQKKSKI